MFFSFLKRKQRSKLFAYWTNSIFIYFSQPNFWVILKISQLFSPWSRFSLICDIFLVPCKQVSDQSGDIFSGIFLGYCQIIWDVWSSLVPLDNPGWIVGEKLLGVTNNYAAAATNYKYKNTQLQKYTNTNTLCNPGWRDGERMLGGNKQRPRLKLELCDFKYLLRTNKESLILNIKIFLNTFPLNTTP